MDQLPMAPLETSIPGSLLIAVPRLKDPNFARMVVLMVHHDHDGAFGIVLGPRSDLGLRKIAAEQGLPWERPDDPLVRYGGPCEPGRIFLCHGGPGALPDSQPVGPGKPVFLGATTDLIRALSAQPEIPVAVFSGYAGWGPGQLEHELHEKSWLPGDVSAELIFHTEPDDLYEVALKALSQDAPGQDLADLIAAIGSGRGASA